jgi:hypothetical protein
MMLGKESPEPKKILPEFPTSKRALDYQLPGVAIRSSRASLIAIGLSAAGAILEELLWNGIFESYEPWIPLTAVAVTLTIIAAAVSFGVRGYLVRQQSMLIPMVGLICALSSVAISVWLTIYFFQHLIC